MSRSLFFFCETPNNKVFTKAVTNPSQIDAARQQMNVHQEVDHTTLHVSVDIVHVERLAGIDHLESTLYLGKVE